MIVSFLIERLEMLANLVRSEKRWHCGGLLHRKDAPAVILPDGTQEWWLNGRRSRPDGGPTIVRGDGTQEWHNKNGQLHRLDAPAVMKPDGTVEWWIMGEHLSYENYLIKTGQSPFDWTEQPVIKLMKT